MWHLNNNAMEKNTKDKKLSRVKSEENNLTDVGPFGPSIFDYTELIVAVFSHLPIWELFNVGAVCRKWHLIAKDPSTWKGVILSTFGVFIGPEYCNIIKTHNGVDLRRAVKDPEFARELFAMDTQFNALDHFNGAVTVLGIPISASKEELIGLLFSDKPIWRSPWLTNKKSKTNDTLFMLPQFQRHKYPQADSLYTELFFNYILHNLIEVTDFWTSLAERAKTSDRSKVVIILCQWLANFSRQTSSKVLDPLLSQFLKTATSEEKQQIVLAQQLSNSTYDWQRHDGTYIAAMNNVQEKAFKANIKAKLFQQPIDMINIPPKEMAKQVALIEQRHFRELTVDCFNINRLPDMPFARRLFAGLIHWILFQSTKGRRREAIVYLIQLAYELLQLRCISGAVVLYSALTSSPISRLQSFKKAKKTNKKEFEEVDRICGPAMGYRELRRFHAESDGHASVPHIGITIADLMFIQDSHANMVNGLINVVKATTYLARICKLMHFQLVPYLFEPVEAVQQLWDQFADVTTMSVDELYVFSERLMFQTNEEKDRVDEDEEK